MNNKTLAIKTCSKCTYLINGMCSKQNHKPYIARNSCSIVQKVLLEYKDTRIARQKEKEELAYNSKKVLIYKLKKCLDHQMDNDTIMLVLDLSRNTVKKHKLFIKKLVQLQKYLDEGMSVEDISKQMRCTIEKTRNSKRYIDEYPDLFRE